MMGKYSLTIRTARTGREVATRIVYGPYELKMASQTVRTVRFVKLIYGS